MDLTRFRPQVLLAAFLSSAFLLSFPLRADRSDLWRIVNGKCVPAKVDTGSPAPCEAVAMPFGERMGFAVLKDRNGATQFLLIPTGRIAGIEDPGLLQRGATNYFGEAWLRMGLVTGRAGRDTPRETLSLAINAVSGRSQDQLHIHMDCTRTSVAAAIRQMSPSIGYTWAELPEPVMGASWRARRIDGEDLGDTNPFSLLADGVPGAREDMGLYTLVLIGSSFEGRPGFVLLASRANPLTGQRGVGEALQDHTCRAD